MITNAKRKMLYKGTALALVFGLTGTAAMAQTIVNQDTTNNGAVTVGGDAANITGVGNLAQSASVSVGSSGAVAGVSVTGINQVFVTPAGGFGTVNQDAGNNGAVTTRNAAITTSGTTTAGDAASMGISASGSGASLAFNGIGAIGFAAGAPDVGNVTQTSSNSGSVDNGGSANVSTITATALTLSGAASSLSVGASGASSSVSGTSIGATTSGAQTFGTVSQTSTNAAATVSNYGSITAATATGDGASVSISARGASAGISETAVGTTTPAGNTYGATIVQTVTNGAVAAPSAISNSGSIVLTGGLTGEAGSASISASAATSSFSVAGIQSGSMGTVTAPSISQTSDNLAGAVTNTGTITLGGATGALGIAASASISGTGAGTFVSLTAIAPIVVTPG